MPMKHILLIALLFVLPITILAHSNEPEGMMVSDEYLDSSIAVLQGVGTYDELDITSSLADSPEQKLALTYTKQGIALHHAFQWEDSVRSFKEALRIDPDMARAYLGMTVSYLNLPGLSGSLDFVADNLKHAAAAAEKTENNEVDRMWVDVMAIYWPAAYNVTVSVAPVSAIGKASVGKDPNTIFNDLIAALQKANDPEVYAFVGWDLQNYSLLESLDDPTKGGPLFPKHTGIYHYLTHIYENTGRYELAAAAAERVIGQAPNAPHLLHMLGHVLPMLGRWDEANGYFLRAHCIHKAVMRQTDPLCANITVDAPMSSVTPGPRELWHYGHNLELFGFSLMRTRDLPTAERIFTDLCTAGNCLDVVEFYLGEGMYDKAISFLSKLGNNSDYLQLKVQALLGKGQIEDARKLLTSLPVTGSIEEFASQLSLAWADANSGKGAGLSSGMKANLKTYLANATKDPNFDTWSHTLPILRKLNRAATQFKGAEQNQIYLAIQSIDKGHPF